MNSPLKNMEFEGLKDEDYNRLDELLCNHCSMNLEMMDGFFTAIIIGPECDSPLSYFPEVFGEDKDFENTFKTPEDLEEFLDLAVRRWNEIIDTFENDDVFVPLLESGLDGTGYNWAAGFLHGTMMHEDGWLELLDEEEYGEAMVPIFALYHQDDPDPEMRPFEEPITQEQRKELMLGISAVVPFIQRYFEEKKLSEDDDDDDLGSDTIVYQNKESKVGRNEPCPCGSGRKYKRCCGAI